MFISLFHFYLFYFFSLFFYCDVIFYCFNVASVRINVFIYVNRYSDNYFLDIDATGGLLPSSHCDVMCHFIHNCIAAKHHVLSQTTVT